MAIREYMQAGVSDDVIKQAELSGNPTEYLLGHISGQMRELIHAVNNLSAKQDAIAMRVASLEAVQERRNGAMAVGSWFMASPLVGWIIGGALAVWALLHNTAK